MNKFFLIVLLGLISFLGNTQSETPKGVIIRSESSLNEIKSILTKHGVPNITYKLLGPASKTILLTMESSEASTQVFDICKRIREIDAQEYNHQVKNRNKPNDPRLTEQYYLELINAYKAWDITTGGFDFANNEIVIGIVDDGFELDHEDLASSILINPDEIAGDGKDNDGNGYIDDVKGWNTRTDSGTHDVKSHGTYVLGLMGAKGNNGKGISGLNWNIKLLPVTTGNYVSDVIESYEYLLAERKQYNISGGKKGSNILVTSYSGGLVKAFAVDHPLWCNVYEKLGQEGVINVTATTNENDNVEVVGDMPSTCTSNYIIVVNSTDRTDEKDATTGFGSISVDVSAPGDRILTTDLRTKGSYNQESGTSLSTPIVAGSLALLYSLKCEPFYDLVQSNPSSATIQLKNIVLQSVDKKTSLTGKTVSGGRLNIYEAILAIQEQFNNCLSLPSPKGPLEVTKVYSSPSGVIAHYLNQDETSLTALIFDNSGKEVYREDFTPKIIGDKIVNLGYQCPIPGIYHISLISSDTQASKSFYSF